MKLLKKTSSGTCPREFWVNSDEYQLRVMPLPILAMIWADVILSLRQADCTTKLWSANIASFIMVLTTVLGIICSYWYEAYFGKLPKRKNVWTAFSDIRNSVCSSYTYVALAMPLIVFFAARSEQSIYCAAWLLLIYDSGFFLMRVIYTVRLHRRIRYARRIGRASKP